MDASATLAQKAAKIIERESGDEIKLEALASRLGCTNRHLRRVFQEQYHVSLLAYKQTCQLLLAKNLLTDTPLSVIDVAMASGFGSLRRFNDLFKKQYRLTPTSLRKQKGKTKMLEAIHLSITYHPPYLWDEMLSFLEYRVIRGIEKVKDNKYYRTIHIKDKANISYYGWICVGNIPEKNALSLQVSSSLAPVLSQVIVRVKDVFDVECDPYIIYEVLSKMNHQKEGLCQLGMRLPGCFDSFEMVVRCVLGQQITVKAAGTIASRMVAKIATPIVTEIEGLEYIFPSLEDILALDSSIETTLGELGVIRSRSNTILMLAKAMDNHTLDLCYPSVPNTEQKKLLAIKGIGK